MAFLEKFKTMFNIGGVNIQFDVPTTIQKHSGEIKGQITIETKGERTVKKVHIFLDQHITKKDHDGNESVDIVTIGKKEYDVNTTLKAGETKNVDFEFHFNPQNDLGDKIADKMMEQGGMLGVIGAVGSALHNVEKTYTLKVQTEIQGALWKPEEACGIKLI